LERHALQLQPSKDMQNTLSVFWGRKKLAERSCKCYSFSPGKQASKSAKANNPKSSQKCKKVARPAQRTHCLIFTFSGGIGGGFGGHVLSNLARNSRLAVASRWRKKEWKSQMPIFLVPLRNMLSCVLVQSAVVLCSYGANCGVRHGPNNGEQQEDH
jgi:hypothetical protein